MAIPDTKIFLSEHRQYTSTIERLLFLLRQSVASEDQMSFFDLIEHDLSELQRIVESFATSMGVVVEQKEPLDILGKALLVDSDPVQLLQTRDSLIRGGFIVEVASNGKQAFDFFCNDKFDLIVTDCQLSELDGFLLTKAIRKLELQKAVQRHIPIIAYTSFGGAGYKERCLEVGMSRYLKRPMLKDELVASLKEVLMFSRD
jgi:CheY-like chemotaxis protein